MTTLPEPPWSHFQNTQAQGGPWDHESHALEVRISPHGNPCPRPVTHTHRSQLRDFMSWVIRRAGTQEDFSPAHPHSAADVQKDRKVVGDTHVCAGAASLGAVLVSHTHTHLRALMQQGMTCPPQGTAESVHRFKFMYTADARGCALPDKRRKIAPAIIVRSRPRGRGRETKRMSCEQGLNGSSALDASPWAAVQVRERTSSFPQSPLFPRQHCGCTPRAPL